MRYVMTKAGADGDCSIFKGGVGAIRRALETRSADAADLEARGCGDEV